MEIKEILNRLLYTSMGQMFISALFGLSLALLFKRVCKDNCTIYIAPKKEEIEGKIFKLEETCYKYTTKQMKCNKEIDNDSKTVMYYDGYEKPDNQIEEPGFLSKIFS
jgi:hypothetical protein